MKSKLSGIVSPFNTRTFEPGKSESRESASIEND